MTFRQDDYALVDIKAEIMHETDQAWLLDDGTVNEWVPKGLGQDNEDGSFTIPLWLAREKGFV